MINKSLNKLTFGQLTLVREPDEVGSGAVNRTLPPEKTPTQTRDIHKEELVCRKCGMGEETAHHILFECEVLGRIHYSVLRPPAFELETIHHEPIKPLLDLIRKAGIFHGI
jgi:hypothetical protein